MLVIILELGIFRFNNSVIIVGNRILILKKRKEKVSVGKRGKREGIFDC